MGHSTAGCRGKPLRSRRSRCQLPPLGALPLSPGEAVPGVCVCQEQEQVVVLAGRIWGSSARQTPSSADEVLGLASASNPVLTLPGLVHFQGRQEVRRRGTPAPAQSVGFKWALAHVLPCPSGWCHPCVPRLWAGQLLT